VLVDENNNAIVGAQLTIRGRESVPFHTKANGEYFRLLMPGSYTIDVSIFITIFFFFRIVLYFNNHMNPSNFI
jgi:hypothetical protein